MKNFSASQARERLAEVLDLVEQGVDVAITPYGKLVAKFTKI